jgi:hypothetical protein
MMFNFTSLFFHINAYSLFLCFILQLTQVGGSDLVVMEEFNGAGGGGREGRRKKEGV